RHPAPTDGNRAAGWSFDTFRARSHSTGQRSADGGAASGLVCGAHRPRPPGRFGDVLVAAGHRIVSALCDQQAWESRFVIGGDLMRKRLLGLIATGAIVVAACGPSAATTAPSQGTTPETAAPETAAPSEAAATPLPENVDDL